MNLYKIVLPQSHNDGNDAIRAHLAFQDFLLATVGGFTRGRLSYGVWQSEVDGVFTENVIPYEIACEDDKWSQIVAKASELFADQQAIFTAVIGSASIVELSPKVAA